MTSRLLFKDPNYGTKYPQRSELSKLLTRLNVVYLIFLFRYRTTLRSLAIVVVGQTRSLTTAHHQGGQTSDDLSSSMEKLNEEEEIKQGL